MAEQGLRVLVLAYRSVPEHAAYQEAELIFAGLAELVGPPRYGVTEAVAASYVAGIRVIMVTGDHSHTCPCGGT